MNRYLSIHLPIRIGVLCTIGVALLLASFPVMAQDAPQRLAGEALKAETDKHCASGCIVLNDERIENLEKGIEAFVQQKMEEAYKAGQEDARERCASLI